MKVLYFVAGDPVTSIPIENQNTYIVTQHVLSCKHIYASGAIVSTSLIEGANKQGEVNVKGYEQRISEEKVAELMKSI